MSAPIRKAIIAVAGFGTRWLPLTKAIEKCMLPIGNRPVIDYVVEDCVRAGITDIYFVVGEQSEQIRRFYGKNQQLQDYLEQKGKTAEIEVIHQVRTQANFHFITQTSSMPYGTAIPIQIAMDELDAGESVVVMMGDQFTYNAEGKSEVANLLEHMKEGGATSGMVVAPVPKEEVSKYGIIELNEDGFFKRIVEKPKPEDAPSTLNNLSMYVLDSEMLGCVADITEPTNGEYYLTDALNAYVDQLGKPLAVVEAIGTYLDAGTPDGWLKANNFIASSQK